MLLPVTLFFSAFLLFCVQPMAARALVPLLGGSSSVWSACLVFFQSALLLGYGYAHAASRWLGPRRHAPLHVGVALLPLLVLPPSIQAGDVGPFSPVTWPTTGLLWALAHRVGPPFFVLAATSPLLSRWYAELPEGKERGAYWLYAASNAGSLASLLTYPLLIEPWLPLGQQARGWALAYGAFVALLAGSAWLVKRRGRQQEGQAPLDDEPLTWRRRLRWVLLSAIPASLLSGVTSHLTADIASIPLLWVLPLGLYLLTFTLCFTSKPPLSPALASRTLVLPVAIGVIMQAAGTATPTWLALLAGLTSFFLGATLCHGLLAEDRPRPARLTEFFLLVSVGGVIGGAFNALLAPLLFPGLVEYPLALVLLCLVRPPTAPQASWPRDLLFASALAGATAALSYLVPPWLGRTDQLTVGLIFLPPVLLTYRELARSRRFALGMAAVLLGSLFFRGQYGQTLTRHRSFYSALRVTTDNERKYHQLVHGNTIHGRQSLDPRGRQTPRGYYYPGGPLGDLFALSRGPRVAVVGLGIGEMAAYARPGERWTFYEIDPLVARIARDASFFTYLQDAGARGAEQRVELGDARQRLALAQPHSVDLLVLDAFSSDAIPTHLLTREALALYLTRVAPGGLLAFHVSNRFLDVRPVLAALAADAALDLRCRDARALSEDQLADGAAPSVWCAASAGAMALPPSWAPVQPGKLWTDEQSSILPLLSLDALLR
jgi:hypothetical protein